jgi:hypothetical protein
MPTLPWSWSATVSGSTTAPLRRCASRRWSWPTSPERRATRPKRWNTLSRAVALDRPPPPQLSAGAWQLKERGQEVAAVRVWHEVRAHAAEVARVAQELAGHVRTWLERAADHVLVRLQPPEPRLAYEGGGDSRERPQDLASRMREAWALRDQRSAISDETSDKAVAPQSLADRLRAGSKALDHEEIAARLAATRQGREVEGQGKAREAEELEQEREARRVRDRGLDHGL